MSTKTVVIFSLILIKFLDECDAKLKRSTRNLAAVKLFVISHALGTHKANQVDLLLQNKLLSMILLFTHFPLNYTFLLKVKL